MITKASECSVKIFMQCLFDGNFAGLGEMSEDEVKSVWQSIYMEYIDLSGIALSTELCLMKAIQGLTCRITLIDTYVRLNKETIRVIGQPWWPSFKDMKKYGHSLWWDKDRPDPDGFIVKLDAIMAKEKRYEVELQLKERELVKYKKSIADETPEQNSNRKDFIRQLNQLEKHGFKIDREKTTVEDLALMVSDYTLAIESAAHSK